MATGGIREIPLTKGYVALVDAADYEWLNQWRWRARRSRGVVYAVRSAGRAARREGAACLIFMHRLVCEVPEGEVPDHKNGDGVDNRRCNLRAATFTQNAVNARHRYNKTGYRGVTVASSSGRFVARTRDGGRNIPLGAYATPEEAARAYDAAARRLHGEFARLNFPEAA